MTVKGTVANAIWDGKVVEKRRPARQWLADINEGTRPSSIEMWRESEGRVTWRNRDSHVAPMDLIVYGSQ